MRANKFAGSGIKNENNSHKELPVELHKPIIRKLKKTKVDSPFIDNIWRAHLADMQLIGKFNRRIRFLLLLFDIFSKYAWVIPLKDKKDTTNADNFKKSWMNLIASKTKYG